MTVPKVICNNLGGLGPEKHVPEQLHFRSAAQLDQGPVDVASWSLNV